jgi:plastocyanin
MNRKFGVAITAALLLGGALQAAPVAGRVAFVTKRGQRPNLQETLVSMEPVGAKVPKRAPAAFQMATRGKMLLPHIMAIPAGSTITFPNQDPISHNLFSLSSGNQFDLGLYRAGAGKTQKFEAPGVVNVYCNVHPNMSAVVHVMTTPYYTLADATGSFLLDVPPGRYKLVAWNEIGGSTETMVDVAANGKVTGTTALTIDSRNHRNDSHLNKEGKPYRAPLTKDY